MILLTLGAAYATQSSYYPRDLTSLSDPPDDSLFTDRSIWNIVWSCFATIFACTWISVHQNIPAPNESSLRVFGRRLAIMFNLLIAPEMVIVWTTRQYLAASDIAKRHKSRGWTKTQAFFAIMGGFSLYQDGVLLRTLEISEMERLEKENKIEWPTITEAEIKDKSKGDFFSKGVVVMQTTWFIIQCIVRGSRKMVLTELEIVTLAFSALTMIIYALWWNKPLDVQLAVPVHMKEGCSPDPDPVAEEKQENIPTSSVAPVEEEEGIQTSFLGTVERVEMPVPVHVGDQAHSQTLLLEPVERPGTPVAVTVVDNIPPQTSLSAPVDTPFALNFDVGAQAASERSRTTSPEPEPKQESPVNRPYHDPTLSLPQQFRVYLRAKREELGLIGSIFYVFMIRPGVMFFGAFYDMMFCTTLEGKQYRVPTFYAPAVEDDSMSILLAILVALVFGGIHCIAWSFEFPTSIEKWAWRVSSVLVSGLPLSISFFSVLVDSISGGREGEEYSSALAEYTDNTLIMVLMLSTLVYIAARGVLLILPLVGLRDLPAGAYVDLNWTAYLPHV